MGTRYGKVIRNLKMNKCPCKLEIRVPHQKEKMKAKIVWNTWKPDKDGAPLDVVIKQGSINGVSFGRIWKQCWKEAEKYVKEMGWEKEI
jgi:hypothetical protein